MCLLPEFSWDGIVLATIDKEATFLRVRALLTRWVPLIAIIGYPGRLSRRELKAWTPELGSDFVKTRPKPGYQVPCGTCDRTLPTRSRLIMTPSPYPRPL